MTAKKKVTKKITEPTQDEKPTRFRIQFDFDYNGDPGKMMNGISKTQPDMSLTVRQLLENHTRGRVSDVQHKEPIYFDMPVPTISDITDVHEFKKSLEERLKLTNEWIEKDLREAAEKKEAEKNAQKKHKDILDEPEKEGEHGQLEIE